MNEIPGAAVRPQLIEVPSEVQQAADDHYIWFTAYQRAGYTAEQAMQILLHPAPTVRIHLDNSPEMSELTSKLAVLLDRDLADED